MTETTRPGDRLTAAGAAIAALSAESVDYENNDQARAYENRAGLLLAEILDTPALDLAGLKAKAEAVAWCCASRHDFGLGRSTAERLMASILKDLLAIAPH